MDNAVEQKIKFKITNIWMMVITLIAFVALLLAVISLFITNQTSRALTTMNTQLSQPLKNQLIKITQLKQDIVDLKKSQTNTTTDITTLKTSQASIATEITVLKATPVVSNQDQTLYLQLATLDAQIQILPTTAIPSQSTAQQKPQTTVTTHTWRDSAHNSWESLKSLIIIRHDGQATPELLSSNQTVNLLQNIHILIAQTQFAVLKHDDAIYHHNLTQAIDWLNRYFDIHNDKTKQVMTSLQDLNKINISLTGSKL